MRERSGLTRQDQTIVCHVQEGICREQELFAMINMLSMPQVTCEKEPCETIEASVTR